MHLQLLLLLLLSQQCSFCNMLLLQVLRLLPTQLQQCLMEPLHLLALQQALLALLVSMQCVQLLYYRRQGQLIEAPRGGR